MRDDRAVRGLYMDLAAYRYLFEGCMECAWEGLGGDVTCMGWVHGMCAGY